MYSHCYLQKVCLTRKCNVMRILNGVNVSRLSVLSKTPAMVIKTDPILSIILPSTNYQKNDLVLKLIKQDFTFKNFIISERLKILQKIT